MDKIRLKAPVHHGDTLYCYTEVLEKSDAEQPDAGIVRFKHYGVNQDDKHVFEGERIGADQAPQPLGRQVISRRSADLRQVAEVMSPRLI